MVITISRQFGSGGGDIGHMLAEKLGVPCYDKTVASLTSEISGLAKELIEKNEDKASKALDYVAFNYGYSSMSHKSFLPIHDQIYIAQTQAIEKLARQGDCVIVGRCASYVLKEKKIPCVNIFIHAPMKMKIPRIARQFGISDAQAKKYIMRGDKARKNYYRKYTREEWGKVDNYDLCISAELGQEKVVSLIMHMIGKE